MKSLITKSLAVAALLAGVFAAKAHAIPTLQLDIVGGVYDPVTQTTVATSDVFTLTALIDASKISLLRNYYLSAAITPNPGVTPSPNFGSFTINGTTYNSSTLMQYGTPPVDAAIGNLASHSIFPTWYAERLFSAVGSATTPSYNVQDNTSGPGVLNYVNFAVDVSGITGAYNVHFDLYTYDGIRDGKSLKIDCFAPFSHDAESGRKVPDGGMTVALLGLGLAALGFVARRKVA